VKEAKPAKLVLYEHTLSGSESLIMIVIMLWMQNPCPNYDLNYSLVEDELTMKSLICRNYCLGIYIYSNYLLTLGNVKVCGLIS
jgi:hypothetical protein